MSSHLSLVRKRDGSLVPFDKQKISSAIFRAAKSVGGQDIQKADELSNMVISFLEKKFGTDIPSIEQIQDTIEKVLIENGHAKTAKAFILYREKRARIRAKLKVRKHFSALKTDRDIDLIVKASTTEKLVDWDKGKIVETLIKESGMPECLAKDVAENVEERIFNSGLTEISTSLIRELIDNELFEMGEDAHLSKQGLLGVPIFDVDEIIYSSLATENVFGFNNPSKINTHIAKNILTQYSLNKLLPDDVSFAHLNSQIHIHNLGYPLKACSLNFDATKLTTGLFFFKEISSKPKSAYDLNTYFDYFINLMQSYFCDFINLDLSNIAFAPLISDLSDDELKTLAKDFILTCTRDTHLKNEKNLRVELNLYLSIPSFLDKLKQFEEQTQKFTLYILSEINKKTISSNLHISIYLTDTSFTDDKQKNLLKQAINASENNKIYFDFDRNKTKKKTELIINSVSINLPQTAYRAGHGNLEKCIELINSSIDIAVKAHLTKRRFLESLFQSNEKFFDLSKTTYAVGIVGLNECIKYLVGEELHESEEAFSQGKHLVSSMHETLKKLSKETNLNLHLSETFFSTTNSRLALHDLNAYPQSKYYVLGSPETTDVSYTASIQFSDKAQLFPFEKIEKLSKLNEFFDEGCIATLSTEEVASTNLMNLLKDVFDKTSCHKILLSKSKTKNKTKQKLTVKEAK